MALPNVQGVGAFAASATAAINPAWPTHAADDWGVLIVATSNETITLTSAQGFVELAGGTSPQSIGTTGSASSLRLAVYLCKATSSSMTAPTIADSGAVTAARIFTVRGADLTTPVSVKAGSTQSTGTSFTNPGITTIVNDCLVIFITGNTSDTDTDQTTWDDNANLANDAVVSDNNTSLGNGVGFGVKSGEKATAGSVASNTGGLATSSVKCHYALAFQPPQGVDPASATASHTFDAMTSASTAAAPAKATSTQPFGAMTSAASVGTTSHATSAATFGAMTSAGTAAAAVKAAAAQTFGAMTSAAEADAIAGVTAAHSFGAMTSAATLFVTTPLTAAHIFAAMTSAAIAKAQVKASATHVFGAMTSAADTDTPAAATSAGTFGAMASAALAKAPARATAAHIFAAMTSASRFWSSRGARDHKAGAAVVPHVGGAKVG